MAYADELCAQLPGREGVEHGGVVLDVRGMERLMSAGLDWAGVVAAASDTFPIRNQRCVRVGALDRIADIEPFEVVPGRASAATRFSLGNEWKTKR